MICFCFHISGNNLAEVGYLKWDEAQPSNPNNSTTCGGMAPNGKFHNVDCDKPGTFICEHDIGVLSTDVGERFG